MKSTLLLLVIIAFYSCTASRQNVKSYYYIEPFKEQEIKLTLNSIDSTFRLEDVIGCNQFEYAGRYKKSSEYLIFGSVIYKNLLSSNTIPFPLTNGDTAWIINSERIFIHKQPFKLTSKTNIDLQQIRYKKLEAYYIDLLGKDGFVKTFGNGKGIGEAKKKLLECVLPDFKPKETD
jgi:hypothetical protein